MKFSKYNSARFLIEHAAWAARKMRSIFKAALADLLDYEVIKAPMINNEYFIIKFDLASTYSPTPSPVQYHRPPRP